MIPMEVRYIQNLLSISLLLLSLSTPFSALHTVMVLLYTLFMLLSRIPLSLTTLYRRIPSHLGVPYSVIFLNAPILLSLSASLTAHLSLSVALFLLFSSLFLIALLLPLLLLATLLLAWEGLSVFFMVHFTSLPLLSLIPQLKDMVVLYSSFLLQLHTFTTIPGLKTLPLKIALLHS